jgi:hypothetical protein
MRADETCIVDLVIDRAPMNLGDSPIAGQEVGYPRTLYLFSKR